MQQLLQQTFHPIHSHLSTHTSQCYFSKIKPKRLTAAYQVSVSANLLKFAGLKEQAIGNPTYQQNCKLKLTVTMEVTHLSATQKQGLGQQTAQFACTTRRHTKSTARIEGVLSWLHSPHCWQPEEGLILTKTEAYFPWNTWWTKPQPEERP